MSICINVPVKRKQLLDQITKLKLNCTVHIKITSEAELHRKVEYKVMGVDVLGKIKK